MGATLAADASCTFSVNVTATMEGVLTNVTGNVTSANGGLGNTASATIAVAARVFQISYESNLDIGDTGVNLTNAGTQGGDICANVYVFDAKGEPISCCSCLVTPNGLKSFSSSDLISNRLTPAMPTSIVKKLLASIPIGGTCNPSSPTVANLAAGLVAWDTTLHASNTPVTYGLTEKEFSPATLSAGELANLTASCGFIQRAGNGAGMCNSCQTGGR